MEDGREKNPSLIDEGKQSAFILGQAKI